MTPLTAARRHFSAHLWAIELEDHIIAVLQLNASGASCNRAASNDCGVAAFD
jgi:hypothetical protein